MKSLFSQQAQIIFATFGGIAVSAFAMQSIPGLTL
ncbi:hypothetical protein P3T25_005133 [Paraburkholderia sp. GAS32]